MRTEIIKVLLMERTSVREYNEILREKKLKFGCSELDTPQKVRNMVREYKKQEADKTLHELFTKFNTIN